MNALNTAVTRVPSPLIFSMPNGRFGWVEMGHGFALDTRCSGQWLPVVDVDVLCAGTLLKPHQVAALVAAFGSPL